ncbi:MAG: polyphosphate polymerase domain-containing protein [Clostridia bacterium]|nr:polyphosphate polymerase domain-containing protein [Clostridia bacterium]
MRDVLLSDLSSRLKPDAYGKTTVRNLYFDNDSYFLIRRSLEKPRFKEKIRLRSYALPKAEDLVFVELKRKFDSVVYKRRVSAKQAEAIRWLTGGASRAEDSQISREVDAFLSCYGPLAPTVFLSYDRQAYLGLDDPDFRVTFDENILAQRTNLALDSPVFGEDLLDGRWVLMELKTSAALPLWMCELLSRYGLYKTSFSKYGTAYQKLIFPENPILNTNKG